MERKLFTIPSFKIYGGIAGLIDFGPAGTPEKVLKASGHVDRFTDFMVRDVVTQDCYRADHLMKDALEAVQADKEQTPEKKEVRPDPVCCNSCIVIRSLSVCLHPAHRSSSCAGPAGIQS